MRGFIARCALATSGAALGFALSIFPLVADAQLAPAPQAMVELSSSDINAWGYAAVVPVGGTITWTNMGVQPHTVTAVDGSFDSGFVDTGAVWSMQFDVAGKYAYLCEPHPWMKGFIVVTPDAPTASNMAMVEGSPSDINSWGYAASIPVGQTVVWTNTGDQQHTATATNGAFDTGWVAPQSSAPLVFDTPGLFQYLCTPHPWMKGAVFVS
jgi:plastocyanin